MRLTVLQARFEKDIQDLRGKAQARRDEASQREAAESDNMDVSMDGLRSAGTVEV